MAFTLGGTDWAPSFSYGWGYISTNQVFDSAHPGRSYENLQLAPCHGQSSPISTYPEAADVTTPLLSATVSDLLALGTEPGEASTLVA